MTHLNNLREIDACRKNFFLGIGEVMKFRGGPSYMIGALRDRFWILKKIVVGCKGFPGSLNY